jgi:hypothetical protein
VRILTVISAVAVLALAACQESMGPAAVDQPSELTGANKVIHRASAGTNDSCAPGNAGCDANFSLVAIERADGTVSGQWQDTFAGGIGGPFGGIHVAVDCVKVVGNAAVIGGVITHGMLFGVDYSGTGAVTAVEDNGTSANDPADRISFSFFGFPADPTRCARLDLGVFPLVDITPGQVKVW